ncbi:hypothetical protein [Compostibacter hankyongensis]|uniref:Uncharacterized protein n=1 Tax=Compostibacter hankyongensis TaxID=1007089 RepID=A0ABP8FDI3_9BACT
MDLSEKAALGRELQQYTGRPVPDDISGEQALMLLQEHIQQLINRDFQGLVNLLYRIDVEEQRLRKTLRDRSPEEAAKVIAVLILERIRQKIKTREAGRDREEQIPEDEKW